MAEMMNNNAAEAAVKAVEETINESSKNNDLLKQVGIFAAGTGFGAGCMVIGRKIMQAVTESKDEIEAEKKKAQVEKYQKQIADAQKKLDELQNEPVEETEEKEETTKKKTK